MQYERSNVSKVWAVWEIKCVKMWYNMRSTVSKVWCSMRCQMCQNVIQYEREVNCVKSVIQYEMSNVSILYSMRVQLCQKCDAVWETNCVKSVMQYERSTVSSPSLSPNTKIPLNYCNAIKLAFSLKFKNRVYPMLSIILTIRYSDLPLTISYYRTYNQNCMSTVYLSDEWKHINLSLKFLNIKGFNFEPIANRVWAKRTRLNLP